MTDIKISALNDGGIIQTTDDIPVERAGANFRAQVGSMAAQSASNVNITGGSATGLTSLNTTGNLSIGNNAAAAVNFVLNAAGLTNQQIEFQDAGSTRWVIKKDAGATGDFVFYAYDNTGAFVDQPLLISRAAGGPVSTPRPLETSATFTVRSGLGALPTATTNTVAHIANVSGSNTRLLIDSYGGQPNITTRASNGTAASPAAVSANQSLGMLSAIGYGATGYSTVARAIIGTQAAQNWTDAAQGTQITFETTTNGTTTRAERMRISDAGHLGVGTTNPAVRLHTVAADGVTIARIAGASFATRTQSVAGVGAWIDATNATEATYEPLLIGGSRVQITTFGTERARFEGNNMTLGAGSASPRININGGNSGASGGVGGIWLQNAGVTNNAVANYSAVIGGAYDNRMALYSVIGWSFVSGAEQVTISNGGAVRFRNVGTTASAANAFLDSADGNNLLRSTSSIRYKTNVEDLWEAEWKCVYNLRPVYYRSLAEADPEYFGYHGFIAEEVAKVNKRLVHFAYQPEDYEIVTRRQEIPAAEEGGEPEVIETQHRVLKEGAVKVPDGVQYERIVVSLVAAVQDLNKRVQELEAKLNA